MSELTQATGRYLLDTSAVIALFADEASVRERISNAEVFISVVVLGELFYGAARSARAEESVARIEALASRVAVLQCDVATSRVYGVIKSDLRTKGRPIPENDIWIAASARQHGLTLLARDRHFLEIDSLSLETW